MRFLSTLVATLFCMALLCFAQAQDSIIGGGVFAFFKPGGGSLIKSIQTCTVAAFSVATPVTCTLGTTVTAANTMLVWNGVQCSNAANQYGRCGTRATLTNGTTVTFQKENANDSVTPFVTAVEFTSHVNNIWYPSPINIAVGNTTGTQTFTSPLNVNAFPLWLGTSTANGTQGDNVMQVCLTICATCGAGGNGMVTATTAVAPATNALNVGAVVVDLDSSLVSNTQVVGGNPFSAASGTDTGTVGSAFNAAQTSLMWAGFDSAATQGSSSNQYIGQLTAGSSSTSVAYTRFSTSITTSRTHCASAVSWNPAVLNHGVQRSTITLTSTASATGTLGTSVNTAKAFSNWVGWNGALANNNVTFPNVLLTSGSQVTAGLNAAGTINAGYEVVEFQ